MNMLDQHRNSLEWVNDCDSVNVKLLLNDNDSEKDGVNKKGAGVIGCSAWQFAKSKWGNWIVFTVSFSKLQFCNSRKGRSYPPIINP